MASRGSPIASTMATAALERQIGADNAENIKAKVVCEAANSPVTFESGQILKRRGITILPDAFVNAGGVTVSYFEWIRNLAHIRFERIERRYDEMRGLHQVKVMEQLTGNTVPDSIRDGLIKGADELDLVRSGLDDTIRLADQLIS